MRLLTRLPKEEWITDKERQTSKKVVRSTLLCNLPPTQYKNAQIKPLFKTGESTCPEKHRTIS